MGELDEISRAIGSMEATQKTILEEQKSINVKVGKIEDAVVKQKVRSAYVAGGVSVGGTGIMFLLRDKGAGIIKFFAGGGGG
jgi:hypothetical protein